MAYLGSLLTEGRRSEQYNMQTRIAMAEDVLAKRKVADKRLRLEDCEENYDISLGMGSQAL